MKKILEIQKLNKNFNGKKALHNLEFFIEEGQVFALIGPNGAGKTTVIKIIVGLYRKDTGSVLYKGVDITDPDSLEKASIGYIPDEPIFPNFLTGMEFLNYIRLEYNVSKSEFEKRLKNILELYPIKDVLFDYPENYSRGNKQKLSIIAGLIHNPDFLIFDEPIVGLDPESIESTVKLFRDFSKSGGTILVSSHTLSFIERVASKIAIIIKGEIVKSGMIKDIEKITKNTNLTNAYLKIAKK
jgi:ABC-2 type transport system ATP-binding protein